MKMNFFHFITQDKKLMFKVISGTLFLVVALSFYIVKNSAKEEELTVSQLVPTDAAVSIAQTSESAVTKKALIVIDVSGAVMNPTVIELPEGSRVYEAIEKAGGLTSDADITYINRAEVLSDGQKLYIPTKTELEDTQNNASSPQPLFQSNQLVQSLININTADTQTLQQLTGIGPATADKIIAYRNENGKFKSIEDIKNVSGIGDKTFEKFKDQITV